MLTQTVAQELPGAMQSSSTTSSSIQQQDQHLRAQVQLLKNHDSGHPLSPPPASNGATGSAPLSYSPYRSSNGAPLDASQHVTPPLAAKSEADALIHPDLRAHHAPAPDADMMPIAPPPGHSPDSSAGPSSAPLAPAPQIPGDPDDDGSPDGRKAKRELSQSKRAAQNRAAQRAFRQRKEGYIKKLEQQVREYLDMEQNFKTMQSENYALREYVLHLQARLLESQGDVPQPPPNVNLSQPPAGPPPPAPPPPQQQPQPSPQQNPPQHPQPGPGSAGVGTPLEAVAQAVAGLAAQEQMEERPSVSYPSPTMKHDPGSEDTRTADEINRQLQPDAGAGQAPAV